MIVSINQPAYLPWLGYFDRIYKSDVHVVLDHVQFEKNSFVNRNRIVSNQQVQMLSVPLNTKGKFGDLAINKVAITGNTKWSNKHYRSIAQSYAKAPFKDAILPKLEEFYYEKQHDNLGQMLRCNLDIFLNFLTIKDTQIIYSSELDCHGNKSDLVLNICTKLKATVYLSGPFGRDYLDENKFSEAGIRVIYHDYVHPTYKQFRSEFQSHMSVVDLLMNHGDQALRILTSLEEAAL